MKFFSDFLFYKKSLITQIMVKITQIPDTEYRGQKTEVRERGG